MGKFISYLPQYWPSLVLLLASCSVVLYGIILHRSALREESESAWRKRVKSSVPAAVPNIPMEPRTIKTTTAITIMVLLIATGSMTGYGVGTRIQSKRDAETQAQKDSAIQSRYELDRAAWLDRAEKWKKSYAEWEVNHMKEKANAGRNTATASRTTAPTTASEPSPFRGQYTRAAASPGVGQQ